MQGFYRNLRRTWWVTAFGVFVAGCASNAADTATLPAYAVTGDTIPAPLVPTPGDSARGQAVMAGRDANCLLCHAVPESGERFMGNVAPPLSGVGARLSAAQLRLRVVDQSRLNRDTVMPSYYRVAGLTNVAEVYRGKPILTAQQIEDVVAYLQTLR
ncbi:MAG: sulfur oxidation c-type cytochrome SoxX [Burkholderiales bacterium]|nr:sulfur oxidation c-type cytochrome SoxX [Burkholderiales bacterium]